MKDSHDSAAPSHARAFPVTCWTLVVSARSGGAESRDALEELCRRYWPPIYAYLRQRGFSPQDSEDYTQQFFSEILTDQLFERAQATGGRLRTFLLAALQRSLADQERWRTRAKRGGGVPLLSLDTARTEHLYFSNPADHRDPEMLYSLAWARDLLERARMELRKTYGSRASLYTAFEPFLDGVDKTASYREVAAEQGIPEVTARVHVSRLRKRYGEMVKDQLRQTLRDETELESELNWLKALLAA